MTPNEDPGVLAWLVDHAWAVIVGLVGIVWKQNEAAMKDHKRHTADALQSHKEEDHRAFDTLHQEQGLQRGHIAKLFDQMRDESQRSEERHRELMQHVHDGQRELLVALNSKADK